MRFHLASLSLFVATISAPAQSHFEFFEPVQPPRAVQVMAHRGLQMRAPENSLVAVLACAADYIEWAEVDVRLSKDGQHVIIHDDRLDRCSDGHGPVAGLTLDELKKLDAGSWFAPRFKGTRFVSLAELLAACKGKVNLYLDCKRIDPESLVKEIRAAEMEKQVIVYDRPEMLAKIRSFAGKTIATMTKFRPKNMAFDEFVNKVDPAAVEIDSEDVTADLCKRFHDKGIRVQAKVLGEQSDKPTIWNRMIEAGVDWLQTDRPAALRFAEVRRRISKFPVQISCHRGANRYAPENTVASIRGAAELGADYIEIDIRTTKDGRFVLLHDSKLDRTTNGRGPVNAKTCDEVTSLAAGAWFGKPFAGVKAPTFDDGLSALGEKSHVYLDAKEISPENLLAAIRRHRLMARHVVYQSPDYCRKLKALEPNVRLLPPLKSLAAFDGVAALKPYGVDANWSILSKEMIARCHAAGIRVFSDALAWHETIADYRQAIGWGIDVIQTDHPLRVLRAIELEAAARH